MTEKDFSQKVLAKIKEKKIKLISRWRFVLNRILFWTMFILSVVIGGMAMSVVIFAIRFNDWDVYRNIGRGFWSFLLISLPYFWIITLLLFVGLAYYNYRHTEKGYKHGFLFIVLISVLSSVFLGTLFFRIGVAQHVDSLFLNHMPLYERFYPIHEDLWERPEDGLLGGKIIHVMKHGEFELEDFHGEVWHVVMGFELPEKGEFIIKEGNLIKIIGEKKEGFIFEAIDVRPWKGNIRRKLFNENFVKENKKPMRIN